MPKVPLLPRSLLLSRNQFSHGDCSTLRVFPKILNNPASFAVFYRRYFFGLIVFSLFFATGCNDSGSKELAPGDPVGSYEITQLDGAKAQLSDLFGKATLLTFVASWCESCKSEFTELNQIHQLMKPSGGLVLAVGLDDTIAALTQMKKDYELDFPVVLDTQARARKTFKLTGFPESLMLDASGAPRLLMDIDQQPVIKFIGPRPWLEPALRNQIIKQ